MIRRYLENRLLGKIGALQSALDRHYGMQASYSRSQLDQAAQEVGFPEKQMHIVYASYMTRSDYSALESHLCHDTGGKAKLLIPDMMETRPI